MQMVCSLHLMGTLIKFIKEILSYALPMWLLPLRRLYSYRLKTCHLQTTYKQLVTSKFKSKNNNRPEEY